MERLCHHVYSKGFLTLQGLLQDNKCRGLFIHIWNEMSSLFCPSDSVLSTNILSHIFISRTHKTKKMNHTMFIVQLILLHYNLAVKSWIYLKKKKKRFFKLLVPLLCFCLPHLSSTIRDDNLSNLAPCVNHKLCFTQLSDSVASIMQDSVKFLSVNL